MGRIDQLTFQCTLLGVTLVLDVHLESHLLLFGDIYERLSVPVTQSWAVCFTHDNDIEHSDIISPLVRQKGDHPSPKSLNLFERSIVCHIERKRFRHFRAPAEINDELAVQHDVRRLDQCVVPVQENGAEESDFLNGVGVHIELNPVANIIRMFDEKENDAGQNFG